MFFFTLYFYVEFKGIFLGVMFWVVVVVVVVVGFFFGGGLLLA